MTDRIAAKRAGGGWPAIWYTVRAARSVGVRRMWKALRSRNTCKTCALGMGGQAGGMVNEAGRFPEVCKKSVQAAAADLRGAIHPAFFDATSLDQLKAMTPRELEAAGRLTQPMYAGEGDTQFRPLSWDEALTRVAAKLRLTDPHDAFFYFSGRSSNEAGFLLQLFARLWGTNNINNCSYYCHQASGVGLSSVTGSGTATIELEDLDKSDLIFLIGANPASNHPRLMRTLIDLKARGGKVIVINPLKEVGLVRFRVPSDPKSLLFGSEIADEYVQPHFGGDIALLSGIAKVLVGRRASGVEGAIDSAFLESATEGWNDVARHLEGLDWTTIVERSGVERATIERIADVYARSKNTIFAWAMGITHHEHGVRNVQAIANLALMRGMAGAPGRGLLPLRGHSNVQGMGSMGVTPALKDAVFARLEGALSVTLPTWAGMDTLSCMDAAHEQRVRVAWCLGGNLFGSNPDATFAHDAMSRIDQVVYLSTTLNTGHAWGRGKETIILPVLARDEERQATTQESMFNFVRLSDGAAGERARYDGPRSEVDVIATVAQAVLGDPPRSPVDWRGITDHTRIRQLIASIIPGYGEIADLDQTKKEFHVAGRVLHERRFPTPSGRAKMHVVALPALLGGGATFRLATIRSEGQFNTVVYEDEDVYRGQERRDVILMNSGDLATMGIPDDALVEVRGSAGAMRVRARRFDVPAGNCAMYYPEANVLIPRTADPQSHTPAFKSAMVTVHRIASMVLIALGLWSTSLHAQRLTGVVTNARSAQPLAGVVVSLLNEAGVTLAQALTDRDGLYRIAVDSSARRMLVRRIGFRLVDRPVPASARVSLTTLDIAMDVIPVDLPPVVSSAAGCRPSPGRPQALALLEQARYGFLATVVARDANKAEVKLIRYRRTMIGAILSDEYVEVGTGSFDRPFVASLEPDALIGHGFTTQLATGKRFHAPDPDLLLSDAFLTTHCFDVAPVGGNHRGEVGVAFTPALGRDSLIEVSGTIWMTRDPLGLKSLEFRYEHLPREERNANAGGTLTFRAAANGIVIVSEWQLTIPPLPGRSMTLFNVASTQSGGVVAWATWPDGTSLTTPLATVSGRVIDEKKKGVADLHVDIPGTPFHAVSDANGAFRIDSVLPGPHEIWIADDTAWRAFGIARSKPLPLRATVAPAPPIDMVWLDADRLTQLRCVGDGGSQGTARLLGKVVDSAGRPLRATVTLGLPTGEPALIRTALGTNRTSFAMRPSFPVTTAGDGLFAYCGLTEDPIVFTATLGSRTGQATVTPSDRTVTRMTITIRNR